MKLKSRLGLDKLSRKALRLLRADAESPVSLIGQEEFADVAATVTAYRYSEREIRSVLLNAEQKKAEAQMEWQKRRFICQNRTQPEVSTFLCKLHTFFSSKSVERKSVSYERGTLCFTSGFLAFSYSLVEGFGACPR